MVLDLERVIDEVGESGTPSFKTNRKVGIRS
jgi:hypothetical protein